MRAKIVTPTAADDIRSIADFIFDDNPTAAKEYRDSAFDTFEGWPDEVVPRRASLQLPEHVREFSVTGFRGYTLRMTTIEDTTYLLAAFAPGLPDEFKDAHTRQSLVQKDD